MGSHTKTMKINSTRNYRLFTTTTENRPLEEAKRRKLRRSMERYGFLRSYPIICVRDKDGHLIVKDGQHRLQFAESLGLPVHWVEDDADFDIAVVNSAAKGWAVSDFVHMHSKKGVQDYADAIEFAQRFSMPLATALAILAGTVNYSNISLLVQTGGYRIKDRKYAEAVAATYSGMIRLASCLKSKAFLDAVMGICRVESFDLDRLLSNAARCRELLVSYSTRDAYLNMLETVYNFGRVKLVGLKAAATMAMRERNLNGNIAQAQLKGVGKC